MQLEEDNNLIDSLVEEESRIMGHGSRADIIPKKTSVQEPTKIQPQPGRKSGPYIVPKILFKVERMRPRKILPKIDVVLMIKELDVPWNLDRR